MLISSSTKKGQRKELMNRWADLVGANEEMKYFL